MYIPTKYIFICLIHKSGVIFNEVGLGICVLHIEKKLEQFLKLLCITYHISLNYETSKLLFNLT